jgi:ribonuclease I
MQARGRQVDVGFADPHEVADNQSIQFHVLSLFWRIQFCASWHAAP